MSKNIITTPNTKHYSPAEERLNIASHFIGLLLSVVGLVLLVSETLGGHDTARMASAIIFGVSLIVLYAASTIYHSASQPQKREKMRVFDHVSIFILIAGTYTPFTLVTLKGTVGWIVFTVVWGLAAIGITLKLFFTGRFRLASTLTYLVMGWLIVFVAEDILNGLSSDGFFWLAAGGFAYTLGAALYMIKKLPFNHALFHLLVLVGSACHFVSVYGYVLPQQ